MSIEKQLLRLQSALQASWSVIEGQFPVNDVRTQLYLAYAGIALEHYEAMILLVQNGLRGSAVVLTRPIFELLYRSAWIHYCAKPNQVQKIKRGKFRFPVVDKMATSIDKAMGQSFFTSFKNSSWRIQNDFVHSGKMQVDSRLTRDDLQSDYSDEMIVANLVPAAKASILVSVILLRTSGRIAEADQLEKMLISLTQ